MRRQAGVFPSLKNKKRVNDYTKELYPYFNVHGRAELVARWRSRGWAGLGRCPWIDNMKENRSFASDLKTGWGFPEAG
jgi:hypothetical protein